MSEPILVMTDVTKRYRTGGVFARNRKTVLAVDGVTLHVGRGEALGLVGESGSGKSTLARMANGLIAPTSGSVVTDGQDIAQLSAKGLRGLRRNVAMVFQDPLASLNPRQTVRQTLENVFRAHGETTSTAELIDLLASVGLGSDYLERYPHEASGGQLQRVAVARALALKPALIIADEPTSALDVSVRAQILNLLADLQRDQGISFLHVSHDLAVIRLYSDRVAVMNRGRIVETGPSDEIFRSPQHPYTQSLVDATPEAELPTHDDAPVRTIGRTCDDRDHDSPNDHDAVVRPEAGPARDRKRTRGY
ncbi:MULTISPECIES: ATP-binding cassette domain-containing protein [unclassified Microbacterium]|uniref:ATP-binding cassette domain-containing protein n=1 Tax=unclassified Microbacterium TaxID=2609290 RepID=UPI000CFBFF82|nr:MULTISPECIES: ATP-binding cassette domain-containing protein [unclassified Microbacterium]PRB07735.1 ABC transporter ATP-binding protein [Microbacterium sp. MYb72]